MPRLFDVVALTCDRPDKGLVRGQVGAVVELLASGLVGVEFSDAEGRSYAEPAASEDELTALQRA